MNEIVKKLMNQANLDEVAAKKAVEVVKEFLADNLPEGISGQVIGLLNGVDTKNIAEEASGLIDSAKGLFGK